MTEYIEREALIKQREEFWQDGCDHMAVRVTNIMNIPAADVVEVRHGKWLITDGFDYHKTPIYQCSVCNKEVADYYIELHKHCLHCGAKMDGKETTNET